MSLIWFGSADARQRPFFERAELVLRSSAASINLHTSWFARCLAIDLFDCFSRSNLILKSSALISAAALCAFLKFFALASLMDFCCDLLSLIFESQKERVDFGILPPSDEFISRYVLPCFLKEIAIFFVSTRSISNIVPLTVWMCKQIKSNILRGDSQGATLMPSSRMYRRDTD